MIRRSVAGAILGISLLVGAFAWSGFVALRTVFDADRSREIAEELLDNDEVRDQLTDNLSFAIRGIIPPEVPVEDEVVDRVTQELLNDPAVEAAILTAFADTHGAFLGEGDVPERLDLTEVARAARASLVTAAPQLDLVVAESPVLTVPLPTERVPDAGPVKDFLETAVPILAIVAGLGALLALLTTNDRPSILRRAGYWALTTTAVYLIIGLAIPFLLRQYAPEQAEVVAALLAALLRSTLIPSIALGAAGVALLTLAAVWPKGRRHVPRRKAPDEVDAADRRRTAPMDPAPRTRRVAAQESPPLGLYEPPARGASRSPAPAPTPAPAPAPDPTLRTRSRSKRPERGQPVPPAAYSGSSPYPDDAHYRETHPPDQWTGIGGGEGGGDQAEADTAAAESASDEHASVFADVPLPGESKPAPVRPAQPTPPMDPAADVSPDATRSVFSSPAEPAMSSAPPAGARWHPQHGWVLDPESSEPRPANAVWVDGVGYVLPGNID